MSHKHNVQEKKYNKLHILWHRVQIVWQQLYSVAMFWDLCHGASVTNRLKKQNTINYIVLLAKNSPIKSEINEMLEGWSNNHSFSDKIGKKSQIMITLATL